VPFEVLHPVWMVGFLVLTAITFSTFGFIIGIWADSFQKLQVIPVLVVTPLTFLGGSFYSIGMLPPLWQKLTLVNPIVYLVNGFRWSFYDISDINVGLSFCAILAILAVCFTAIWRIFVTGYKLKA
jgi:ABC-2 type transport system permease protein